MSDYGRGGGSHQLHQLYIQELAMYLKQTPHNLIISLFLADRPACMYNWAHNVIRGLVRVVVGYQTNSRSSNGVRHGTTLDKG